MNALALAGQTRTGVGKSPARDRPCRKSGWRGSGQGTVGRNPWDPKSTRQMPRTSKVSVFRFQASRKNILQSTHRRRRGNVHGSAHNLLTACCLALHLYVPTVPGSESLLVIRITLLVAMCRTWRERHRKPGIIGTDQRDLEIFSLLIVMIHADGKAPIDFRGVWSKRHRFQRGFGSNAFVS